MKTIPDIDRPEYRSQVDTHLGHLIFWTERGFRWDENERVKLEQLTELVLKSIDKRDK